MRSQQSEWLLELKQSLLSRLAARAMTTRTTGLDGLAKTLLQRATGGTVEHDPELDHPDEWDRPID